VVHATNAGRRPLSVDVIGLSGPRWRPRGNLVAIPAPAGTPPISTLEPGASAERTIARSMLWQQALEGRRWVYAGTALGTGRYRRIPAAVIRHVAHGPPVRGGLRGRGARGGAPGA
jgi:hypothetical protein